MAGVLAFLLVKNYLGFGKIHPDELKIDVPEPGLGSSIEKLVGTYGTAPTEPNTVSGGNNITVVSPELIDQSEDENLMERSSSNVQGNLMHTLGRFQN